MKNIISTVLMFAIATASIAQKKTVVQSTGKKLSVRAGAAPLVSKGLPRWPTVVASVVRRHFEADSLVRLYTVYEQQPSANIQNGIVISDAGNTKLTCQFGDTYAATWYVYSQFVIGKLNGETGDNYIEVQDSEKRIIARVNLVSTGNIISIRANNNHLYFYHAGQAKNVPIKFSCDGTNVNVSVANRPYVNVGKWDGNADIHYPSILYFSQWNDHGRGIPVAHNYRGISTF